jgi:hypothetical protein
MLGRLRQTRAGIGVAALYALAMIMLGLAHRPVALPNAPTVDLAAYALPDGAVPTLCGHSGDSDQGPQHSVSNSCEACALTAAAGLVGAPPALVHKADFVALALAGEAQRQFAPAVRYAPSSRGPPLS